MTNNEAHAKLVEVINEMRHLSVKDLIGLIRKESIKGIKGHCGECLLARFLSKKVGCKVLVGVHYAEVSVSRDLYVALSESMVHIIRQFDKNLYPDLVEATV